MYFIIKIVSKLDKKVKERFVLYPLFGHKNNYMHPLKYIKVHLGGVLSFSSLSHRINLSHCTQMY